MVLWNAFRGPTWTIQTDLTMALRWRGSEPPKAARRAGLREARTEAEAASGQTLDTVDEEWK